MTPGRIYSLPRIGSGRRKCGRWEGKVGKQTESASKLSREQSQLKGSMETLDCAGCASTPSLQAGNGSILPQDERWDTFGAFPVLALYSVPGNPGNPGSPPDFPEWFYFSWQNPGSSTWKGQIHVCSLPFGTFSLLIFGRFPVFSQVFQ